MLRFLFDLLRAILFGNGWRMPEFSIRPRRLLHEAGLVMSTLFVGRHGSGKTYALAMELWEQIKNNPEQPFFIFDWSGGLINALLQMVVSDRDGEEIKKRLVYDSMAGRAIDGRLIIMPMPEFSKNYDPEKPWLERVEDQGDRVQRTIEALYQDEMLRNPTMIGRPIKSLFPNPMLLANAIVDQTGNSWQITETTRLLNNQVRKNALREYGKYVGKANEYFNVHFTGEDKIDREIGESLADVLDILKSQRIRARVGYPTPGWTPNEAIRDGLVVLCDGSGLNNNHKQKDYAYLQLFNLVLDEINKRVPSLPYNQPINWVMDEVYTFTEIPKVAQILSHLPSEYRSRKLQLFLVLQSLKQLEGGAEGEKGLKNMIFSFGNMCVFSLLDIEDCFAVSENFFPFDPNLVKIPARQEGQHDIMENRDEQLAERAYHVQHLAQRECYVRRFANEAKMDRIIHVGRTRELTLSGGWDEVERLKDELMSKRGVLLSYAERQIAERKIVSLKNFPRPPSI